MLRSNQRPKKGLRDCSSKSWASGKVISIGHSNIILRFLTQSTLNMPARVKEAGCGLCSPDHFQDYMQYKQDTKTVIEWLLDNGGKQKQYSSALRIRELYSLAANVVKRKVQLPGIVDYCFNEAIKARSKMSRRFRARFADPNDQETAKHEHFTQRSVKSNGCQTCLIAMPQST